MSFAWKPPLLLEGLGINVVGDEDEDACQLCRPFPVILPPERSTLCSDIKKDRIKIFE